MLADTDPAGGSGSGSGSGDWVGQSLGWNTNHPGCGQPRRCSVQPARRGTGYHLQLGGGNSGSRAWLLLLLTQHVAAERAADQRYRRRRCVVAVSASAADATTGNDVTVPTAGPTSPVVVGLQYLTDAERQSLLLLLLLLLAGGSRLAAARLVLVTGSPT